MSWNIRSRDSATGNKANDKYFNDILNKCDIFCLQETRKDIKIPNYVCYNRLRNNSSGGGVCIGVKRSLAQGISKIDTLNKNDVLAIRLNKNFFKIKHDIILFNSYIPPSNSSYLKKQDDPFESLNTLLERVDDSCKIILCGDFNARSGGIEDRLLCDNIPGVDSLEDNSLDSLLNDRNCMDINHNSHGSNLIDLTVENNLSILNGRISGDIFGEFTYINYSGASVIDYFAVSHSLLRSTNYLKINDLNNFSDHKPLIASFSIIENYPQTNETLVFNESPLSFKWDDNSAKAFTDAQLDEDVQTTLKSLEDIPPTSNMNVLTLNKNFIDLIQKVSTISLNRKRRPPPWNNKNIWFDDECRAAKRKVNKGYRNFNKYPDSMTIKSELFDLKRHYNKLLNYKKRQFMMNLNKNIEGQDSKNINWKKFKKLKGQTNESLGFDDYDLKNFFIFFKKLYHDNQPLSVERCNTLNKETEKLTSQFYSNSDLSNHSLLDDCFTMDELEHEIRKLKIGKSASLDLICNEMIKNLNGDFLSIVLNLFNGCLSTGTYPWLDSIMSPIPKTGDKYNPDNYRAIALGSCLGKLFSNLLLYRIQKFRLINCPDLPNQLGFAQKAQTSDHILTLKTLIDKYTCKKGSKLYACFVDFRKAFDSVARQALLYKLAKLGIGGKIFKCLKYMYDNTGTKIKLINKLSDHINLKNGVEQGHPLSPELFKIYILDLSQELEKVLGYFPHLKDNKISHLLWADDLVLLALDEQTLQSTLDVLNKFCVSWGLQVNPKKTKILIFNKSGRLIKPSTNLRIGDEVIESTKVYCYLGIVFTPSGSFTTAINELKKKALRATFALKKFINHKFISVTTIFKLFDALIIPILTYACQVTFPFSKIASSLITTSTAHNNNNWQSNWLSKISKDPFENLHLKFIKWILGVHKKASNLGSWGETGKHPIGIKMLKQTINYFNRVSNGPSPSSLVHLSYLEQQENSTKWYSTISKLLTAHSSPTITKDGLSILSAGKAAKSASTMFESIWKGALTKSPKLDFYNSVKQKFIKESYLDGLDFDLRKIMTRLRISAHRLPIEKGRYLTPPLARTDRFCEACKFHLKVSVVGDENHFLLDCVSSLKNKNYLSPHNAFLLNKQNYNILSDLTNQNIDINNLAIFIRRSYLDYLNDSTEVTKAKNK